MAKMTKSDALNNKAIADRTTAFDSYASYIGWLPNPDPVLKKAGKSITVYKELITDPFIKGCYNSRKAATLSLEWDIDRGQAKSKAAKFIKSVFENIDVYTLLSNMLDAPAYGYTVFEIVWQNVDGYIVPVDILKRPSEWFQFGHENELLFKSKSQPMGEPVPANKFLIAQHNASYSNPYGEAILSDCFWPATFKKGGLKFWVTFTEKFGMPWVTAKVPTNWTEEQTDELIESLGNMVQDGVLVVPETADIAVQFAGSAPVDVFKEMLQFCKDDISMAFLGHTKAGQSVAGELGNQNQAKEVRGDIVLSDKRMCEQVMNELVDLMFAMNFETGQAPRFIMFEETDVDKVVAERDKIMWDMGVRFTQDYFKKTYYLTDDDFNIETGTNPASVPIPGKTDNAAPKDNPPVNPTKLQDEAGDEPDATFAEPSLPEGQVVVDTAAEKVIKSSRELIADLNKQVKEYINGKTDFADAIDGLAQMYPKLNTEELYNKLVSIQFAADLVGRFEIRADKK